MSQRGIELNCIQKCGDYFYDLSAAIISIIDVITDILVTYEFWILGRKVYFSIAVGIFILAQFCYALLFTLAYGDSFRRDRSRALCFMCIFPFAQIVPLFMWLDSYNIVAVKKILKAFNLSQHVIDINKQCPENKDQLQFWLEQKFMSHGGFLIEAAIEAFPQSILQMIAIVMYQEATPLNVVSIVVSMTSVASKMLMFSYSIDRVTFMFNFFCLVSDIFGIFCTLSWVFYHPEDNYGFKTFDFFTIAGKIWIIKILSMVGLCLLVALLLGITALLINCTHTFCIKGKDRYLKCCPCCFDCGHAHAHGGTHPTHNNSACDNCKVNCIFCLFACKFCCYEICCQGGRQRRNNAQSQQQTCKRPCCAKSRKKCAECTWRKCRTATCDVITGILALIAVVAFVVLVPVAAVFLFGIAVMALEIAKLLIIPAMFWLLETQKHRGNVKFYKPIFDYLLNRRDKNDYHVRLAIVNYTCCQEWAVTQNYIQGSIQDMDSDHKIAANFIHGLQNNLGPYCDWMKALMIPNTFNYVLQTRKLSGMKKKRKMRQEIEFTLRQNGNSADRNNAKNDNEIVELRVSVDNARNDVSDNATDTTTNTSNTYCDVALEGTGSVAMSSNIDLDLRMEDEFEDEYKYQLPTIPGDTDMNGNQVKYELNHLNVIKKAMERDLQVTLIPDKADDDIDELENWINDWESKSDHYSDNRITKYIADNPHDIRHLLSFKPKDYRNITKTGPLHMLHVVFVEFVQEAWKEISGDADYKNINNCGRVCVFFGLFFLCFGIYVLVPCAVLLVLTSLFYPIIAIIITYFVSGFEAIHYLQLTLTLIYVFVLLSLLIMMPRVYKFQHANFHFYASRRNLCTLSTSLYPPRKQQFAIKYINLYATMQRNEIIKEFWGDMYVEFMQFLPPTHNIDINIKSFKYSKIIKEYEDKHIQLLQRQVTNKSNTKIQKTLLDYMD